MGYKLKPSRLLAILLSVVLVLTMLPATAFAATVDVGTEEELRTAITNAAADDTISIDGDIILTSNLSIDKNITLTSSNGSILNAGTYKLTIAAGGDVTFGGDLAVEGGQNYLIEVLGTFTLTGNASVERSDVAGNGAVYANGGTVNIEGGSITETYSSGYGINLSSASASTLTISGGVISGHTGVRIMSGCTGNISGGNIQGNTAVFVGTSGTVTISGGTLTGSVNAVDTADTVNITGGTFTGKVMMGNTGTINVDTTGGNVNIVNGVYFNQSGQARSFLSAIPDAVSAEADELKTIELQGVHNGVDFLIDAATDSELGATISDDTVTLSPTAAGIFTLVLTAQGITFEGAPTSQTFTLIIPVTVTGSALAICEIDGTPYPTLDDALAVAATGQSTTINLLQSIDYEGCLEISDKTIVFALGAYDLAVDNTAGEDSGAGLFIDSGGHVSYTGTGSFSVTGDDYGVRVYSEAGFTSSAEVTSATAVADEGYGIKVDGSGASAVVNGAVAATNAADGTGVYVSEGSATVTGSVTASTYGVEVLNGGNAVVTGDITVSNVDPDRGNLNGVYTYGEGSEVVINGGISVTGNNIWGVRAAYDSVVRVNTGTGDSITATGSYNINGIDSRNSNVTADRGVKVTGDSSCGIIASNSGTAAAGGVVVEGDDSCGVDTWDYGSVTVNGNVYADGRETLGAAAHKGEGAGGLITVNGNVTVCGEDSIGARSTYGSAIVINGNLSGEGGGVYCDRDGSELITSVTVSGTVTPGIDSNYINFGDSWLAKDTEGFGAPDPEKAGYIKYTPEGSTMSVVWVADGAAATAPVVVTGTVTDITGTRAFLSGSITSNGGAEISASGFVYSLNLNPTTGNHVVPGTVNGDYITAVLTGLVPGTTYHVRAYAINSAGTAYGADRSFTTPLIDPPGIPINRDYLAHDGAVELLWEAPGDGGSPIMYYEIMRGNDLTQPWTNVGNVTSYTVTGLNNGENYFFNVRAVNAAGAGDHGSVWATPNIPTVPGPPRELNTHSSSHQVQVSWREPWFSGYRDITGYEVSLDNSHWTAPDHNSSHTFTGLTNGVPYIFYVRAVNAVGSGEASSVQAAPRSSGGGHTGTGTFGGTTYNATVDGGATSSLPISVDTGADSAVVDLESIAEDVFDGGETVVTIPVIPGVNTYTVTIPSSALDNPEAQGNIILATDLCQIDFPGNMLSGTGLSGEIGVIVGEGDKSGLPDEAQAAVGDRPVIQLTLTADGVQTNWNNPDAPVTVSIPYEPTEEELADPEHIVVWYIDGSGNVVSVPSGRYDPATGTVTFTTTHFSYYAVAYVHKTFVDLDSVNWAKKAIEVMASKGIINGTGKDSYSPAANITRGDYLALLMKTLGLTAQFNGNFDDVTQGTHYYEALGIAKKLGIAAGGGDNLFLPKAKISRQDMMALTARALEKAGKLEVESDTAVLDQFTDKDKIKSYAVESLAALIKDGLITGSGNKLNPGADTTRAEAAVFLYRIYNM